ncbi:hypothetical protein [Halarchaeum sp. P4]|uniref:hypothetical protein n=1 Tax=Halarchaeum sp. P4 TaxID=3421639 RepID=UPI003EB93875
MADTPDSGGEPQRVGRCTSCGRVFPVQVDGDAARPIGTDGTCVCGNATFRLLPEEE